MPRSIYNEQYKDSVNRIVWSSAFLIVAIIAAVIGFSVTGVAAIIAQVLFVAFFTMFVIDFSRIFV